MGLLFVKFYFFFYYINCFCCVFFEFWKVEFFYCFWQWDVEFFVLVFQFVEFFFCFEEVVVVYEGCVVFCWFVWFGFLLVRRNGVVEWWCYLVEGVVYFCYVFNFLCFFFEFFYCLFFFGSYRVEFGQVFYFVGYKFVCFEYVCDVIFVFIFDERRYKFFCWFLIGELVRFWLVVEV